MSQLAFTIYHLRFVELSSSLFHSVSHKEKDDRNVSRCIRIRLIIFNDLNGAHVVLVDGHRGVGVSLSGK